MTPEEKAWIEGWKRASVELPKIRDAELRSLDERAGLELLGASYENPWENGLVKLQAYLMRLRVLQLENELERIHDSVAKT
jgi:hypothetical protein